MANYRPGLTEEANQVPRDTSPPFDSVVYANGINLALDVPAAVSEWFDGRGHVPVLGQLDGLGIRATLVPRGEGRHRLFLNLEMRDAAGVGADDEVHLVLWPDPSPRGPELPDDVGAALREVGVLDRFLAWSPSRQLEYLVVIEDAKTPDTRTRRIERTVAALNEQATEEEE